MWQLHRWHSIRMVFIYLFIFLGADVMKQLVTFFVRHYLPMIRSRFASERNSQKADANRHM